MACPSVCGRPVQRALGTQTDAPVQSHTHLYCDQTNSMTSRQSKVSGTNPHSKYHRKQYLLVYIHNFYINNGLTVTARPCSDSFQCMLNKFQFSRLLLYIINGGVTA